MAWDSLHLFGPCQEDRSSAEKNDLEGEISLESVWNRVCRNCADKHLTAYFSDQTDDKLGF